MNQNHVDLEHAQLLKEAGWEWETEKVWVWHYTEWLLVPFSLESVTIVTPRYIQTPTKWLPAPNISELRERLTWDDFYAYWHRDYKIKINLSLPGWLYDVTADPNTLAAVWVWKERGK